MGKRDVFALGIIVGGAAAWLWASQIEGYVVARTRGVRTRAVEGLRVVEEQAGRVLDRGESSLHRAEGLLRETRANVSGALRAGQDAIRPVADPPAAG